LTTQRVGVPGVVDGVLATLPTHSLPRGPHFQIKDRDKGSLTLRTAVWSEGSEVTWNLG
jgi:hypothetical protein